MSGGSFDYNCFKISQFADDLMEKINRNDEYDSDYYGDGFNEETLAALKECHSLIQLAGKIAHHVGWLYSREHTEEDFVQMVIRDFESEAGELTRRKGGVAKI